MILIDPIIEQYASSFSNDLPEEIIRIFNNTNAAHSHAHLMSSVIQGKYLAFMSKLLNPLHILEIGTFTGFSTLCLAEGLKKGGDLHTIELREQDANSARTNFSFTTKNKQIHLHIGNAKEIIPNLPFGWDFVFIDADKTSYIDYYELVVPRLNKGGVIIADNVLFHGKVVETPFKDKNTKAIDNFNRHVSADARTSQLIVPLRDGLMMIKKNDDED